MKLTLDQAWELCLEMWPDVVREWKNGEKSVKTIKDEWLDRHGWVGVDHNCFFCERCRDQTHNGKDCTRCPGKQIDKDFRCVFTDYDYDDHPDLFLAEIRRLNKIRRSTMKTEREILDQSIEDHQRAIDKATDRIKKLDKPEVTYSIADRFRKRFDNEKFIIIIQTEGGRRVAMASLSSGCLCYGSHEVDDSKRITQKEFEKIADTSFIRYWDSRKKENV